jgi:hypothetical protein
VDDIKKRLQLQRHFNLQKLDRGEGGAFFKLGVPISRHFQGEKAPTCEYAPK